MNSAGATALFVTVADVDAPFAVITCTDTGPVNESAGTIALICVGLA